MTATPAAVPDRTAPTNLDPSLAARPGTRNPTLAARLRERLGPVPLRVSDELGLLAAALEAGAFALLGFFARAGLPASVPSCTGARHTSVLGSLTAGRDGWSRWGGPPARPTRLVIDQERSSR